MSKVDWSRRSVLGGIGVSALSAAFPGLGQVHSTTSSLAPAVQFVDMDHPFPSGDEPQQKFDQAGIKLIGRYYSRKPDPQHPTGCNVPGKILTASELHAIERDPGRAVVTAFQFCNRCSGFGGGETSQDAAMKAVSEKGKTDGNAAIDMAKALGQPEKTPIYFGVDFDPEGDCAHQVSWDDMSKRINEYFKQVNAIVKPKGWKIGVYGFGAACTLLKGAGLADYFWLSASVSHPGTRDFFNSGEWHIFQDRTSDTDGYASIPNVDTDLLNPAMRTSGQWRRSGAVDTDQKTAADILAGRFFLTSNVCAFADRNLTQLADSPAGLYHWTARVVEKTDKYIAASFDESSQARYYFRPSDIKLGLQKNMPPYFSGIPRPSCHV